MDERQLAQRLAAGLEPYGLIPRGGFNFEDREARPAGPSGVPARSVLLAGSAGGGWWQELQLWLDSRQEAPAQPLDMWSREILGRVADHAGARLVMPSDRPYLPFQQWAMRAEGLKPSPIGLLMHPEYGLWHAYRAALLFDEPLPMEMLRTANEPIHLCDLCDGKPCLTACPVGAYSVDGFAYQTCLDHVRGSDGGACLESGCLDRNACPYGADWRYPAEAQAFLQHAFAKLP